MAKKKTVETCGGMEAFLQQTNTAMFKRYHNNRTCYEAYEEIKRNLAPFIAETERGAMASEVSEILNNFKTHFERVQQESPEEATSIIQQMLSDDPIIYLNNHGREHIEQVIERADAIVSCFVDESLSEFEAFLLLCAIQIHDIGNILGRSGHEKKLNRIFDEHSKDIILDTAEKRVIKNIAMAHGGKNINGSRDTISQLSQSELIFQQKVRTRLLAAILRFADELADDSTRRSRAPLELDIIGTNSKIYHDYSRVLHTVNIGKEAEKSYVVNLIYELEKRDLEEQYQVAHCSKYLLDEIYDRTIKMERERRYCAKFMHSNINIEKINVSINIYGEYSVKIDTITYTLEDVLYPSEPLAGNIKLIVGDGIRSGSEELKYTEIKGV